MVDRLPQSWQRLSDRQKCRVLLADPKENWGENINENNSTGAMWSMVWLSLCACHFTWLFEAGFSELGKLSYLIWIKENLRYLLIKIGIYNFSCTFFSRPGATNIPQHFWFVTHSLLCEKPDYRAPFDKRIDRVLTLIAWILYICCKPFMGTVFIQPLINGPPLL